MEISVVHPSLNKAGGAERYCLEIIRCLQDTGHHVHLYTIDKTDWKHLRDVQSINVEPDSEYYQQEKQLAPDGLFTWLRIAILYTWLLVRGCEEADICINNYGEVLPLFAQVSIVHSVPMSAIVKNNYGIPLWRLLRRAYLYTMDRLSQYHSEIIVTNSSYNAGNIKHGRVMIIHPPVHLPQNRGAEKNGEILTVARLKASKNLNKVAEIAANSRNRYTVAGRSEYGSERLIKQLRGFKNITVYANPRREDIIDLMNRCSVYLSTQPDEAFGMAVVEAMNLGCIPLVYRGGGPWSDILAGGEEYGLAYSSVDEAVDKIRDILFDEERRRSLREKGALRAQLFTVDVFRERFTQFIEALEPREKTNHRVYRLYRNYDLLRKRVRDRASTLVPL